MDQRSVTKQVRYDRNRRFVANNEDNVLFWRAAFFRVSEDLVPDAVTALRVDVYPEYLKALESPKNRRATLEWEHLRYEHGDAHRRLTFSLLDWAQHWGFSPGRKARGWREEPASTQVITGAELDRRRAELDAEANLVADLQDFDTAHEREKFRDDWIQKSLQRVSRGPDGRMQLVIDTPARFDPGEQCAWTLQHALRAMETWKLFRVTPDEMGGATPKDGALNLLSWTHRSGGVAYYDPLQSLKVMAPKWEPLFESEASYRRRVDQYADELRKAVQEAGLAQAAAKNDGPDHLHWLVLHQVEGMNYDDLSEKVRRSRSTVQEAVAGMAKLLGLPERDHRARRRQ